MQVYLNPDTTDVEFNLVQVDPALAVATGAVAFALEVEGVAFAVGEVATTGTESRTNPPP